MSRPPKTIDDLVRAWARNRETCSAHTGELRCTRGVGHGGEVHEMVEDAVGLDGERHIVASTFFR